MRVSPGAAARGHARLDDGRCELLVLAELVRRREAWADELGHCWEHGRWQIGKHGHNGHQHTAALEPAINHSLAIRITPQHSHESRCLVFTRRAGADDDGVALGELVEVPSCSGASWRARPVAGNEGERHSLRTC